MLGTSSRVIEELFLEAWKLCIDEEKGGTKIHILEDGYDWRVALTRPPRPLESVILDNNMAQTITDDLKLFFKSRSWYEDLGIPYRRGVLLHGPPGCGKVRKQQQRHQRNAQPETKKKITACSFGRRLSLRPWLARCK